MKQAIGGGGDAELNVGEIGRGSRIENRRGMGMMGSVAAIPSVYRCPSSE